MVKKSHLSFVANNVQLAHYMKIPPKTVFACQVAASIWACFVQIAVMNWTLGAIPEVCTTYVTMSIPPSLFT